MTLFTPYTLCPSGGKLRARAVICGTSVLQHFSSVTTEILSWNRQLYRYWHACAYVKSLNYLLQIIYGTDWGDGIPQPRVRRPHKLSQPSTSSAPTLVKTFTVPTMNWDSWLSTVTRQQVGRQGVRFPAEARIFLRYRIQTCSGAHPMRTSG
jgi:hypothetical protein